MLERNDYFKIFGIIVLIIGSTLALHSCGVFTTAATAPGRVVNNTLGTDNIIHSYEWFFDVKAEYDSRVAQVQSTQRVLVKEVDSKQLSMLHVELSAQQQSCRELANRYNAQSRKANKSIFKDNELPETLSATACES